MWSIRKLGRFIIGLYRRMASGRQVKAMNERHCVHNISVLISGNNPINMDYRGRFFSIVLHFKSPNLKPGTADLVCHLIFQYG